MVNGWMIDGLDQFSTSFFVLMALVRQASCRLRMPYSLHQAASAAAPVVRPLRAHRTLQASFRMPRVPRRERRGGSR